MKVACVGNHADVFDITYTAAIYMLFEGFLVRGCYLNDETGGRFAEELYNIGKIRLNVQRSWITQVNLYAQGACYCHLSESDGQATLRKIMARAYQSCTYGRADRLHNFAGVGGIYTGYHGIGE